MYHPSSSPAFLPPGVKGGMFSLCPKNSSLYTTHEGLGNGSQVPRIVTRSLRVPCEWMQCRMTSICVRHARALRKRPDPPTCRSGLLQPRSSTESRSGTGGKCLSAVVKYAGTPGSVASSWPRNGFLYLVCSIPGPLIASPPLIRDKSRMR
jgi:hypothetical protein